MFPLCAKFHVFEGDLPKWQFTFVLDPKEQFGWLSIADLIKMHHWKTFIVTILYFTKRCFAELDFHHALIIISHLISLSFLLGLNDPLLHLEMNIYLMRTVVPYHRAHQNHYGAF